MVPTKYRTAHISYVRHFPDSGTVLVIGQHPLTCQAFPDSGTVLVIGQHPLSCQDVLDSNNIYLDRDKTVHIIISYQVHSEVGSVLSVSQIPGHRTDLASTQFCPPALSSPPCQWSLVIINLDPAPSNFKP